MQQENTNQHTLDTPPIPSPDIPLATNQNKSSFHVIVIGVIVLLVLFGIGGYILLVMGKSKTTSQSTPYKPITAASTLKSTIMPTVLATITTIPTQTAASLQTYTNAQLGLSFTYPGDWTTIPYEFSYNDDNNVTISHGVIGLLPLSYKNKYAASVGKTSQLAPFVAVLYWDNPRNLSLQAYNQSLSTQSDLGLYTSDTQTIVLAGRTSYHNQKADCDPVFCDRYIIPLGNKFIVIQRFYPNSTDTRPDTIEARIFSQIISSIHF